jgi:DNA primase
VYDKSRHVYGLHLAKDALRTSGFAVLVEGNLDVIASHQAGVKQTVATAGTALTEMHLKALHRFTSDVRLCFDADKAGQAAAERAIPIASKVGVSLRMVLLEGGKDPDELIQKDPSLWEQAIGKPQDVLDWLMDRYALQLDLATAPGKRQFSDIMLHVVRQLTDQVEQDHYLEAIARRIDTSKSALEAKLKGVDAQSAQPRKRVKPQGPVDQQLADRVKAQNHFLSLMLLRPALREYLDKVDKAMFTQPEAIALYSFLCSHRDFKGEVATARSLQSIADYIKIITLLHEALYQDVSDAELAYEAARLHVRLTDQFVKTKKADIAHALQTADEAETTRLLQAVKRLDNLLNNAKELDHAPKSQT